MTSETISTAYSTSDSVDDSSVFSTPKTKAQTKAQKQIVDWCRKNFIQIKQARGYIERQWYLNMCFYCGKQNVVFRQLPNLVVGVAGNLYVPPAPYWRSRPVINRVRPAIRSELAKLTSQKPSATVVPSTSDDLDLFAAQAGDQIWDSTYRSKNLQGVFRRWIWWGLVCGTSFLKCYWDPDAIDEVSNQKGDFTFNPETPFHVFVPDFRAEDLEAQPFIIHAHVKSQEWVDTNYPGIIYSASVDKENDILDQSWLSLIGAQNMRGMKSVLVLEAWIKPGGMKRFPKGAMFTVIGDTLVQGSEGWPYEHNKYPFAKFDHIPTGKFYSESSITDLIPLQREYNRTRGQIIEAKNKMAKPQLMAEKGSIDASKMTTEPGQVIEYQPGFSPPTALPMPSLPQYVLQELDRILLDINDISGQHDVSKGQTPPGVTSATAINYLQEQDDTMLAHTYQSLEEAIEKIAKMTLSYAHQYWNTPRTIKVVGKDGSFDAQSFKGSDLRGQTDIRVEGGSSLPTSKAAKQAFIMDLMKMGFIDPAVGLEVMEMGGISKIYENVQVDSRQAQRENLKMSAINDDQMQQFNMLNQIGQPSQPPQMPPMMQGMPELPDLNSLNGNAPQSSLPPTPGMPPGIPGMTNPSPPVADPNAPLIVPVNTWDNHQIHISEHNKYRKSQSFENLPDSAKQLFESHVQHHIAALSVPQPGAPMPGMPGAQIANQPPETVKTSGANDSQTSPMFSPPEQGQGAEGGQ